MFVHQCVTLTGPFQAYDLLGLYFGIGHTFFNPASVSINFAQVNFIRYFVLHEYAKTAHEQLKLLFFKVKVFSRVDSLKEAVKNYTMEATPDDRAGVLQQVNYFQSLNWLCHRHLILLL
jgi:Na+-translocating ferredoxin:NAD+ oxidoreductase RnfD subunit